MSHYFPKPLQIISFWTALAISALTAQAEEPQPTVVYSPGDQTVEGNAPLYGFHIVQVLAASDHSALPGQFVPTPNWTVISMPNGVTDATALSYVSFILLPDATPTPTEWTSAGVNYERDVVSTWRQGLGTAPTLFDFTYGQQHRTIGIIFDGPTDATPGDYAYKLKFTGWSGEGTSTFNDGTDINVRVLAPVADGERPIVGISRPSDLQKFYYTFGGAPVVVNFEVTGTASTEFPISDLTASVTEGPSEVNLSLSKTGLGTNFAKGLAQRSYSTAGVYTLNVTATNPKGSSSTNSEFEVIEIVPPPTISITAQSGSGPYTYTKGLQSGVDIEFLVTGKTLKNGILSLTSAINGPGGPQLVTLSDVVVGSNVLIGTGVASLSLSVPGTYTLYGNTTSAHGEADTTITFEVVALDPDPEVEITSPSESANYLLGPGGAPVLINYVFDGSVPFGNLESATVTVSRGSKTLSTNTLPSPVVSGTGSVLVDSVGSVMITTTVTSDAGKSASDSVTVLVSEVNVVSPTIDVETPGEESVHTFTFGGPGAQVPVSITTNIPGNIDTIASLAATLATPGGATVTLDLASEGIGSASANGTQLLDLSVPGTYTISAVSNTLYGGAATATTTFHVRGIYPPPAVTIGSPVDGLEVVRFESDAPSIIDFTYFATIDFGGIESIAVTVNGNPVVTTHTAVGPGFLEVVGSGSITSSASENFVIVVTATGPNGDAASDSIVVKVIESNDPDEELNCSTGLIWLPPISLGKTLQGGSTLPIKFKLFCTEDGDRILDPEVTVVVIEELPNGGIGDEWYFVSGDTPNGDTYKITGPQYHKNFVTQCGVHTYRVEVYRPKSPGSVEVNLLSTKLVTTQGSCADSPKSEKSSKSTKSNKSSKSDKSDKSVKTSKSEKSGKSDKSGKSGQSSKSGKSGKSEK